MTQNEFDSCLRKLSGREEEVLRLFLQGKSDPEIFGELNIVNGTVKSHFSRIYKKFGLTENEYAQGCSHRDELTDLFVQNKGNWVANGVRVPLGHPRNLFVKKTGSNYYLKKGIECFNRRQCEEAIKFFEEAVNGDRTDPYAQIYLNNARAYLQGNALVIAVVAATHSQNDFHKYASEQVLRGTADAQTEFNKRGGKGGRLLEIDIRNDGNRPSDAEEIATKISDDLNILAVVGHHSSESTQAALRIYEENSMAIISSTSTSSNLKSKAFFRTIASTKAVAKKYVQYIQKYGNLGKISVFYHKNNTYSQTLKDDFAKSFEDGGGVIEPLLDISNEVNP